MKNVEKTQNSQKGLKKTSRESLHIAKNNRNYPISIEWSRFVAGTFRPTFRDRWVAFALTDWMDMARWPLPKFDIVRVVVVVAEATETLYSERYIKK